MGKFSLWSKIGLVTIFLVWLIFPDVFFIKIAFTGIDVGRREYLDIVSLISLIVWYLLFRKITHRKGLMELGENRRTMVLDGDAVVFAFAVSTALTALWNVLR